jgi:hypothetical protein
MTGVKVRPERMAMSTINVNPCSMRGQESNADPSVI